MSAADGVRIRRAALRDASALLAMESLFPSDRMSIRSIRRFIAAENARVLVAIRDRIDLVGNLVLLLRAGSAKARIYSFVVGPAARGLGIGDRLVHAAERAARRAGRRTVTLEVRADNLAARSLYAKRGYVEARRLPAFYDDGADGLRLELALR